MILILEDDADREAWRRGMTAATFVQHSGGLHERDHTVWISPEAYAKDVVLAELREKVEALPHRGLAIPHDEAEEWALIYRKDVLALIDKE